MLVRNWIVCIMVFSTRVSREEHPTDEKLHQLYAFVDLIYVYITHNICYNSVKLYTLFCVILQA